MSTQPDFFLYDRIGRLAAVIEVRNRRRASSQWAAELRRNLLAAVETYRGAPFFLLATPDRLYLWKDAPTDLTEDSPPVLPDYEVDAKPLFSPYLGRSGRKLEEIHRPTFELIVLSWLWDLIRQARDASELVELEESGLRDAAKNGRIFDPVAA
jgi:hypothetical protein